MSTLNVLYRLFCWFTYVTNTAQRVNLKHLSSLLIQDSENTLLLCDFELSNVKQIAAVKTYW